MSWPRGAMGGDLYFHRPRPEVMAMWRRTGFLQRLGEDHIFPDKATALRTRSTPGWTARSVRGLSGPDLLGVPAGQPASGRLKMTRVPDWGRAEAGAAKGVGE